MEKFEKWAGNEAVMEEELAKAVFLENIRLKQNGWKVDTEEEKEFWSAARKRLLQRSTMKHLTDGGDQQRYDKEIFREIMELYAREIVGNFEKRTYNFASKALPVAFHRMLNTASQRNFRRLWSRSQFKLSDRIKPRGHIDEIRDLATKGTVILLPTHHSNLDSLLIGWVIHCLGLPAFTYGAGLNLFNNPVMRYFFGRLGAYKLDRRKKNQIYLQTLKAYSQTVIEKGCHSLFYPGGTRSRSGQLETKLKLGLVGTAMEAQRKHFAEVDNPDDARRIFVVPLVLSYHFIFEAESLINGYLKAEGKERFFTGRDSVPSTNRTLRFIWKFFSSQSEIYLSLGKPMDLFGNNVDENGLSVDKEGKSINIRDYFVSEGELKADDQRDMVYTQMLGQTVIEKFYQNHLILSSYVVAFVAFKILERKNRRLDIYGLMRLQKEDRVIPFEKFKSMTAKVVEILKEMEGNQELCLSEKMHGSLDEMIEYGLKNLGVYHHDKALRFNKKTEEITSDNMKLLFFYHNRLKGYGLEKKF